MRIHITPLILVLILLIAPAAWAQTITVNASAPIRTIPMSMYGGNLQAWDGTQDGNNATFNALMKASGRKYQRIIGGSWSNGHLWSDIEDLLSPYNNPQTWKVSYEEFLNLLNAISEPGEEMPPTFQPIVNFPGGWYGNYDAEGNFITDIHGHQAAVDAAVAWVQDQTARPVTAQYWEIGNEVYGPWEVGWFSGINGTYYGNYFADFQIAMKAANPNIKIGAVAYEKDVNGLYDWYTGRWTYDLLRAAQAKGVVPDYLIIHMYPGSGQRASYNSTLLGADVDNVAVMTSDLNAMVTDAIGSQYVGQVKYAMTEWDAGAHDTYDRTKAYVNAMFHTQYILEMCKHNWVVSNAWSQAELDNTTWRVNPVWWAHPLLIHYFGRDMVQASSSDSSVRAYAAKDATGALTLFLINNSPTSNKTANINISGFSGSSAGQQWLIAPAGAKVPGGTNNARDNDDLSINGVASPSPLIAPSVPSQNITTGSNFSVSLPANNMLMVRIPSSTGDLTPPATPTGLTATPGSRTVALNWNDVSASDLKWYRVYRSTTPGGQTSPLILTTASEYTDTGLVNGTTYYYTVSAVDNSFNASAQSAQVSATPVAPPQTPFGGTPWAIPGTIEAENYDEGGETVAYHDLTAGNTPAQYRLNEDVDVETCTDTGGGFNVGWVDAGEWLEYTVNVAASGTYNIAVRAASATTGGGFTIQMDGVAVASTQSVPNTGDWQTWTDVAIPGVNLTAGQHVLRINMDGGAWNFNKITVSSGTTTVPTAPSSLAAAAVSSGQINLSWADNSSNEANFELQRATDSAFSSGLVTTTLGANTTSASATGLAASTTYYFRVRATNSAGASAYSNTASATTQSGGGTATTSHVDAIAVTTVNVGQGNKAGQASVTVRDNLGNLVSGATVTGNFTGSINESGLSAVTNASGVATLTTSGSAKGGVSVTFCVTNITAGGLTYNASANVVTCGSN